MKKLGARFLCLALWCAAAWLHAAEQPVTLTVEPLGPGEFEFNPQSGVATADKGVVVRYGTAVLTATKVTVNQVTGEVLAEGNVHLEHDGQVWAGERAIYNFKTRQLSTGEFKTGQIPYFILGHGLDTSPTGRVYMTRNAVLTTDDYAVPGYTVRAKKLTIAPGQFIEGKNVTFWLGKVPVLWWPYTRKSLGRHPNNWVLTPGYRSLFGPYLLTTYNSYWSERLSTALHLDGRVKRGLAGGPEARWRLGEAGEGAIRYYFAHDLEPGTDPMNQPIRENRQRLWFAHQATLRTNLTVKAVVRYQSDAQMVRDFFESEYRENVQPSSFLEANQDWPNWNLSLYAQPRVNDFYETVERLPDVKLTGVRQELGHSPFYYESECSFGWYRHLWPDVPTNSFYPVRPDSYSALRADTYHQIVAPWSLFGWLNVAPRVGGRFTHYGAADGAGATTTEQDRWVFNTGVEVSFKASRVWRNAHNRLLEVKGLRHIIEPSVNYVYVPEPSPQPTRLPQFDSELATYRLLPIDYPDYNAIDSIDTQNAMRFGVRNKLQTKRADGVENLVNWALYTDWRLRPHRAQGVRPAQGTFADLYSDLDFKPRSWITFNSQTRFDLKREQFQEAYHYATILPNDIWSISLGHRYLDESPVLGEGNNLIFSSLYFRLSENWGARFQQFFEARDGTMEQHSYTIYRDMRSWTMAVMLRFRENRVGQEDWTIAITFSLKAFPRFGLGSDVNRPSLLLGS